MKHSMIPAVGLAALLCGTVGTFAGESMAGGVFDFGRFSPPANGGQFVEVNVKSNLIAMVARLAEKAEPQAAQILRGLHQVRVNVIGLDADNTGEIEKRVKEIRSQLDSHGWEPIVMAQDKKDSIGVYLKTRGSDAIEGLVVTAMDGKKEALFVNIVGNIQPDKIAMVAERLNIEPLKKIAPALEKK